MGAARRLCVRAVVLTVMMSALLSLALPSCQFPEYGIATGGGAGSAGTLEGGMPNLPAGAAGTAGDDPGGVGGDGNAGAPDAGAAGEPERPSCVAQSSCVPGPPADWVGPIAFWEGMTSSALPDCPPGYANPNDRYRDLSAPNPCTCTCAAQGQACSTTLHIHSDQGCAMDKECATVSAVSTCKGVSGCIGSQGTMVADAWTISGGSCAATITPPGPVTWRYHARLCQPTGSCDDPSQVCAPTPPLPYVTQRCVTRVMSAGQTLPECPLDYPLRNETLYEAFTDTRSCTACGCSSVSGGSCSGQLLMGRDTTCSVMGIGSTTYPLEGGGCQPFNLGSGNVRPTSVIGQYTVTPGTCSVASQPSQKGDAVPSGRATVVCCKL